MSTAIDIPETLLETLRSARAVTVLTGAGISAESGIPTFRDSQTGLWAKYDPHELATPEAFARDPRLVMDWYRWRRALVGRSQPNPGHVALAQLEQRVTGSGGRFTLITQNVDGLHALAGSSHPIELHGSLQRLRCSNARCDSQPSRWVEEALPRCPACGALLRPDIVWFGEMLPQQALQAAMHASQNCEIFFSIGTSGVVEPAASLPYEALRAGAAVVEINPHPTPLNIHARYCFAQPSGVVLPEIVARL